MCQHRETLKSALKQGQNCPTLLYVIVLDCYLLKWVLNRGFIFCIFFFFFHKGPDVFSSVLQMYLAFGSEMALKLRALFQQFCLCN